MKDGSVVEYGSSFNSRVNISSKTEPLSWNISKITDEFGNYMTFTYINNSTTTGDFLISEINYTGNASAYQLPYNKVVFEYEDYTNFTPCYFDGVKYCKTKRLKRVKTYAEGRIVKYGQWLNKLEKSGKLIYSVELSSCVTHTSLALNLSGIFNIGIHPYILNAQMYLWANGLRPWSFNYLLNQ